MADRFDGRAGGQTLESDRETGSDPSPRGEYRSGYGVMSSEEFVMADQLGPLDLLKRLMRAQNDHDIDAFVACFSADYRSEQPVHPDRAFAGREQVHANWSSVFAGVPDFHAELIRSTTDGPTFWAEWRWTGTRSDGSRLDDRGVTIFGVERGQLAWGRLYLEPVQEHGGGIDAAVERMRGGSRP